MDFYRDMLCMSLVNIIPGAYSIRPYGTSTVCKISVMISSVVMLLASAS